MAAVFASLIPVFLIIATGWLCRVTEFVDEKQWAGLERVTYVVFFPALIINTLTRADLSTVPVVNVGSALIGAILLIAALLLAARPALTKLLAIDGPSFTSVFQGATRWNTFVAIAMAGSLFGQRGVTVMAVAVAAMVPLLNVLAIYALVRFAGGPRQSARQILYTFVTNPFIWSCAIGILMNALAPPLPKALADYIDIMGRAALAAGLLVVGAGLDIRRLAKPGPAHFISVFAKLLLLPTVAVLIARALGVSGTDLAVTVVAASVPSASGAFVLARQMGGNAPLMAEIITLQTLAAMLTMPLIMALLAGM